MALIGLLWGTVNQPLGNGNPCQDFGSPGSAPTLQNISNLACQACHQAALAAVDFAAQCPAAGPHAENAVNASVAACTMSYECTFQEMPGDAVGTFTLDVNGGTVSCLDQTYRNCVWAQTQAAQYAVNEALAAQACVPTPTPVKVILHPPSPPAGPPVTRVVKYQPPPRRVARLGQLGSPPGFDNLISTGGSQVQQAWATVQTQLSAEAPQTGINAAGILYNAQNHFTQAYNTLSGQVPGIDATGLANVANAAATLALQNNTVLAVGNLAENLVQGAVSGNQMEVVQALVGATTALVDAEVGAAISAGSVSCGVGAAIMVGIAVAATLIEDLFSSTNPTAVICNSQISGPAPTIVVGCAYSWGAPVQSGTGILGSQPPAPNPLWRRFPEQNVSADAWWYTPQISNSSQTTWTSGGSSDIWGSGADARQRPIDGAFPQYHQLECDAFAAAPAAALPDSGGVAPAIVAGQPTIQTYTGDDVQFAKFILAYFGAWKANQEPLLNGQKPTYVSDGVILQNLLSFWNASHSPGATKVLQPWGPSSGAANAATKDVITYPNACQGWLGNEAWYISMVLGSIGDQPITINTGPKIVVPNTLTGATASAASNSTSTGVLVVGGLLAAGAAGTYLYGRRHHMTFGQTLKSGWNKLRHPHGRKR
jgi:hypothetical protein